MTRINSGPDRPDTRPRAGTSSRWRRLRSGLAVAASVAVASAGLVLVAPGAGSADSGRYVYWTNYAEGSTIGRASADGTSPDQSFITGASGPTGIALDDDYIYWANNDANTIGRAKLNGTSVNQSFITSDSDPFGVAVTGDYIYWTNLGAGTIGRARLDGSGTNQSFITGAALPTGIAIDDDHVYWANFGTNALGRANLDGTSVNQSFITGASGPFGVAVTGDHIYWTNQGSGTIGRARLDGSGKKQSFITGASGPFGVAIGGDHVYWTNGGDYTIGRARLDGSGKDQSFVTGTIGPVGIAVTAQAQEPESGCVKKPKKLPTQGTRKLEKARCFTNAGQRVGVKVVAKKSGVQAADWSPPGKFTKPELYCEVSGKKDRATRKAGYGAGFRYCKKGKLMVRTFGGWQKITVTWKAPAIAGYTKYKKTKRYRS
ncbi:MAG: DUF5050 domain-containing protein [Candidatus Nanopelagicales bacterium]|nr:DUF5050 domain-containing protein [Candidatus Nanopelagicales bacterium]